MCEEHDVINRMGFPGYGSSPRVRGTPEWQLQWKIYLRFIPACAGNTWYPAGGERTPPVHPRVCGEHMPIDPVTARLSGSSPRVRGTQQDRAVIVIACRFIPACAGNTLARF
ncbi:hypothetical protein Gbth_043_042 [Gluconobacter thailandicus F149-1 = NBRC 100600]|nr:hypothetical protein Gbth_043_042 [Gluconobacter thailandicus F149-1 = NBRC 100600]